MTKEEKTLLFKDLSSRASYDVKVKTSSGPWEVIGAYKSFYGGNVYERVLTKCDEEGRHNDYPIEAVKPYLRPMSSMTEEEREEYEMLQVYPGFKTSHTDLTDMHDWLLANHFDFRELIPMGLALEAPEGMYENK